MKNIIKKNFKLENFGFTLVELLAVIVVLGVIMTIVISTVAINTKKTKQQAFETVGETIKNYLESNYENCKLSKYSSVEFDDELFNQNDCSLKTNELSNNELSNKLINNSGYKSDDIEEVKVTEYEEGIFGVEVYPQESGKFSGVKEYSFSKLNYASSCWEFKENTIISFSGINKDNTIKEECTGYISKKEDGYSLKIPSKIGGEEVTIIRANAFNSKNLISVTIPNGVKSIGDQAFYNNNLTSITIPDSVETIGVSSFRDNDLTFVTLSNKLESISDSAFSYNKLTSVTIPNSVGIIGEHAFFENQLISVTIPDSVESISESAFSYNKLTSITIPNSVKEIGNFAFSNNDLNYPEGNPLIIPSSVTKIGANAFITNHNLKAIKCFGCNTAGFEGGEGWNGKAEVTVS